MPAIKLEDILKIERPEDYKAHFADFNQEEEPLDVFVRDRTEWKRWNEYKKEDLSDFNRRYIFSLISFYPERDVWLFGGIYEVHGVHGGLYNISLTELGAEFIGRLKIQHKVTGRARRLKFERCYPLLIVSEVLKEPFAGESFCGYENIDLTFAQIEAVIRNERTGWKDALQSIKGVYLVTDTSTGKKYVGSAYNAGGVWARWRSYVETGHGGNSELMKLMKEKGAEYAKRHFKFTLLEYRPMRAVDQEVIDRETFWKRALLSRGDYGYNKN